MTMTDTTSWVLMFHKGIGGVTDAPQDAYERLWSTKGWTLIEDQTSEQVPEDALRRMAFQRGINLSRAHTQAEMIGTIKEALIHGS